MKHTNCLREPCDCTGTGSPERMRARALERIELARAYVRRRDRSADDIENFVRTILAAAVRDLTAAFEASP